MTAKEKAEQTLQAKVLAAIFNQPGLTAESLPVAQRRFLRVLEKEGKLQYKDGGWFYTAEFAESLVPGWKYNCFNPENIEVGDFVRLESEGDKGKVMKVESVSGRFTNKIYCAEIGKEYYAQCFSVVRKGNAVAQAKWEAEVRATAGRKPQQHEANVENVASGKVG